MYKILLFVLYTATTIRYEDQINWYTDFDEALSQSNRLHKPVLLYFGISGCSACKHLKSVTLSDKQIMKELKNIICVEVDLTIPTKKAMTIYNNFSDEDGVPQLSFLTSNGKEVKELRTLGIIESGQLLDKLNDLKSRVSWINQYSDSIQISRSKAIPVLIYVQGKDRKSEELLFEIDKMATFKAYSNTFVWFKIQREGIPTLKKDLVGQDEHIFSKIEKASAPSFFIVDPYSYEYKEIRTPDAKTLKKELFSYYKLFKKQYYSENKVYCYQCKSVLDGKTGNCCNLPTITIRTFYCESCKKVSRNQKSCCDKEKTVITE